MIDALPTNDVDTRNSAISKGTAGLRFFPLWLGVGFLCVGLVIYLSLIPLRPIKAMDFPFHDKAAHLLAYGATMSWFGQIFRKRNAAFLIAASLVALGVIVEFLQGTTVYRTFEIYDMVANAAGILAGLLLSRTRFGTLLGTFERALKRSVR
ncbi:MAG TPA: VanZ family protein [Syntrophorhabdaceae bacterium]